MDKRSFLKGLGTAAVAAPVAAVTAAVTSKAPSDHAESKNAYKRIMQSGVIRAAWFAEPPFTMVDPNTKKLSGIAITIAEKIANGLNIKLEWIDGFNFTTLAPDLDAAKFDVIMASTFILPRAGRVDYVMPFAYVPVHGYMRHDETRFSGDLSQFDNPVYKIAAIDGEGGTTIARQRFPKAQFTLLPQGSQISELLLNVAQRKADLGFTMPGVFAEFDKANPGLLKPIPSEEPLHIFAVAFSVRPGENELKSMLNNSLQLMIISGEIDKIFAEYDPNRYLLRPSIRFTK